MYKKKWGPYLKRQEFADRRTLFNKYNKMQEFINIWPLSIN